MARGPYTDEQIDAAIEAISDPEVFRETERQVARAAPRLQRILADALGAGGWFGESHEGEVLKAATTPAIAPTPSDFQIGCSSRLPSPRDAGRGYGCGVHA